MKLLEDVAATLLDGLDYTSYEQVRCESYGVPGPTLNVVVAGWRNYGWKKRADALMEARGWRQLAGRKVAFERPDGAFVASRLLSNYAGQPESGFELRTREFYEYAISPKAGP